jgi:hypothetical protein
LNKKSKQKIHFALDFSLSESGRAAAIYPHGMIDVMAARYRMIARDHATGRKGMPR